jgi:ABC-2 type transport system ATP-binding protein
VLYTTHYMEEAERLCDRVGIIDEGQIKAEGTRAQLVSLVGERDRVLLGVTGFAEPAVAALQGVAGVDEVSTRDGAIVLIVDGASRVLPELLRVAAGAGVTITGVEVEEPNLETVFLHLTGKALRD